MSVGGGGCWGGHTASTESQFPLSVLFAGKPAADVHTHIHVHTHAHKRIHTHTHTGLILDLIAALQLIILKGGGEEVKKRDVLGEEGDWGGGWGWGVGGNASPSVRPRQPLERA